MARGCADARDAEDPRNSRGSRCSRNSRTRGRREIRKMKVDDGELHRLTRGPSHRVAARPPSSRSGVHSRQPTSCGRRRVAYDRRAGTSKAWNKTRASATAAPRRRARRPRGPGEPADARPHGGRTGATRWPRGCHMRGPTVATLGPHWGHVRAARCCSAAAPRRAGCRDRQLMPRCAKASQEGAVRDRRREHAIRGPGRPSTRRASRRATPSYRAAGAGGARATPSKPRRPRPGKEPPALAQRSDLPPLSRGAHRGASGQCVSRLPRRRCQSGREPRRLAYGHAARSRYHQ